MRRISAYVFAIIAAILISACTCASAASSPNLSSFFGNNWSDTAYPVYDGLTSTGASSESSKIGGIDTVVIIPESKSSGDDVGVIHQSVSKLGIKLEDVQYIRYYYYYESDTPFVGRPKLVFPKSEFNLANDCTVYACDTLVEGNWTYLNFNVGDALQGQVFPDGTLPCFEFYPLDGAESGELSGDRFGIMLMQILGSTSTLATNAKNAGTLADEYPIYFRPGRVDTEGSTETIFAKAGEKIILPECGYTRDGYEFNGWICSIGNETYLPGDEYTVTKLSRNGGMISTGRTDFIASWKKFDNVSDDFIVADYGEFWGGLVKPAAQTWQYGYADVYKNYEFCGIDTLRLVFKPNHKDAGQMVNLDGYSWHKLPLDISKYKCILIPYYFKTSAESLSFNNPTLLVAKGNTGALSGSVTISSRLPLVANKWSFMVFEIDFFGNPSLSSYLAPNAKSTIINQCHIRPFGHTGSCKCSNLLEGDELYFGEFIFLDEIPNENPQLFAPIVNGMGDGTFRPASPLTRAEAAVMLAKALGYSGEAADYGETAYSDLDGEIYDWCRPYIYYLEKKGILNPQEDSIFKPDGNISGTDFRRSIVNARSEGEAAKSVNASAVQRRDDSHITRGEAVSQVFTLLREYIPCGINNKISEFYTDVDTRTLYSNEIFLGTIPTVKYKKNDGSERVIDLLAKKLWESKFAAGDAYIKELDEITAERISEIRAAESVYSCKEGGKTVYVSTSSGSADSDGLSESNPILLKTLNDASSIELSPGDVLLFKRGDTFRGSIALKKGVTYSAYGTGEKPLLTRSPENGAGGEKWKLVYSEDSGKKIWKYYDESYIDAGSVYLIDSEGNHTAAYKEVPSYRAGKYWVRGRMPGENVSYPDGQEFIYTEQLDRDLEFFHEADSVIAQYSHSKLPGGSDGAPKLETATGPIYLRCDSGNPGEIYDRIEFNLRGNCMSVGNACGVTVDNLCIKYFGSHGIGAGNVNNLTVTSCEIGYGGGAIQNYQTSANYSSPGTVVRFGNGIEIYGGLVNYTIDNCYVYEIYDAGITHQISAHSDGNYFMYGVNYTNNVLERCIYNIEYFMAKNNITSSGGTLPLRERYMKDVLFEGNICRMAGYGWGVQRPDGNYPSNIKGSGSHNLSDNYVIRNNIFDRTVDFKGTGSDYTIGTHTAFESSTPYLENNIFVQVYGRILVDMQEFAYYKCGYNSENILASFGGVGNKVYFATDDKEEYENRIIW